MSASEPRSSWEPENEFGASSLENVIYRLSREELHREKTSDETAVHIRSLPWLIWDAIKYLSAKPCTKEMAWKSVSQGCLMHAGLLIIEHITSQSSRTKERWLKAVEAGDTDTSLEYIRPKYSPEYLGKGIGVTRRLSFLNPSDKARAMEISSMYGYSLSQVATLALIAGIAQSESLLPRHMVNLANKEINRFRRDWK